jgi:DNA-binding NarL/FixJ family response regulator
VSPATIRNHVQNILGKLGVHSRLEAVAYATRNRLI